MIQAGDDTYFFSWWLIATKLWYSSWGKIKNSYWFCPVWLNLTFSRFPTVSAFRRFVTSLQLHSIKTLGLFKISFCKKSPCFEAVRLFLLGGIFFTSRWLWTHPSSSSLYLLLFWKLFCFLTDLVECLTALKCYWCDNLWTTYWHKAEQQLISHQLRGMKSVLCTHSNLFYGLICDEPKWFRISLWTEMQNRPKIHGVC